MPSAVVDSRRARLWRQWALALAWLATFVALIYVTWVGVVWLEQTGAIAAVRARGGVWAAVALTFFHAAVAVSPAPGETVAIANSAIFGFGWGVAMNWAGWMLAAMVEFGLVRGAVRSLSLREPPTWMPGWLRRLPADHPAFLIVGRWVPFGGHVVNAAAGLNATFRRHLWCAAVSIVPVAVLFSALANGWRFFW